MSNIDLNPEKVEAALPKEIADQLPNADRELRLELRGLGATQRKAYMQAIEQQFAKQAKQVKLHQITQASMSYALRDTLQQVPRFRALLLIDRRAWGKAELPAHDPAYAVQQALAYWRKQDYHQTLLALANSPAPVEAFLAEIQRQVPPAKSWFARPAFLLLIPVAAIVLALVVYGWPQLFPGASPRTTPSPTSIAVVPTNTATHTAILIPTATDVPGPHIRTILETSAFADGKPFALTAEGTALDLIKSAVLQPIDAAGLSPIDLQIQPPSGEFNRATLSGTAPTTQQVNRALVRYQLLINHQVLPNYEFQFTNPGAITFAVSAAAATAMPNIYATDGVTLTYELRSAPSPDAPIIPGAIVQVGNPFRLKEATMTDGFVHIVLLDPNGKDTTLEGWMPFWVAYNREPPTPTPTAIPTSTNIPKSKKPTSTPPITNTPTFTPVPILPTPIPIPIPEPPKPGRRFVSNKITSSREDPGGASGALIIVRVLGSNGQGLDGALVQINNGPNANQNKTIPQNGEVRYDNIVAGDWSVALYYVPGADLAKEYVETVTVSNNTEIITVTFTEQS